MPRGDTFRFKSFNVRQANSAMKVGTDGVVLGAWARCEGVHRVLDVGAGTGLISLMIAQRNGSVTIDAVEIDSAAAAEAEYNFQQSPYGSRLTCYNTDFQSFARTSPRRYDLIVSNPPYFDGSYTSGDAQRTAARHTELLSFDDLIEGVLQLLEPCGGRFAAIFPYSQAAIFIAKAASYGLYCSELLNIYGRVGRPQKRMAGVFSMERGADIRTEDLVVMGDGGDYTEEFRALTRDFYVRF